MDGTTEIADEQPPVVLAPQFRGARQHVSLLYDSDVYHTKRVTEVVLNGHAYSRGTRATQVDVTMRVGPIQKTLRVTGDRVWEGALSNRVSAPKPFDRMPLIYERAYQRWYDDSDLEHPSWDLRNPVGVSFRRLEGSPLPNVDPEGLIRAGIAAAVACWFRADRFALAPACSVCRYLR